MSTGRGLFVAVEGTDGSGKGTQCKRLAARLTREGYDVAVFDFPQYNQPSSFFVQQYLNGKYGSADTVGPYTASLFYALDRYEAAPKILQALAQGKVVLANRFVGSNMAHQGTKFQHAEERRGFFIWLDNLEFEMLRIPRPNVSFVLRVPAETAQSLVDTKGRRAYTDKKRDIHEADLGHLTRSVEVYDDMCRLFPNDFVRIDCTRDGQLVDIEALHEIIWQKVSPMLPRKPGKKSAAAAAAPPKGVTAAAENPYIRRNAGNRPEITDKGKSFLEKSVTAAGGDVYAFTRELNQTTIVAAMADALRAGTDVRTMLLETRNDGEEHTQQRRIIESYGEEPFRQLSGIHIMAEEISSLLAGKIEQGRLATYLGQAVEHMSHEQKSEDSGYQYYVPDYFEPRVQEQYRAYMDQIYNLYSEMLAALTDYLYRHTETPKVSQDAAWQKALKAKARDAIQPVLPVAARTALGVYASGEALEGLIVRLMSDTLSEARKVGEAMLAHARKTIPALAERIATPERGGAAISYRATAYKNLSRMAQEYLPDQYSEGSAPVQLIGVWPRNELDLVPDMLYKHSALPLDALQVQTDEWPYDKKAAVFEAYIGGRSAQHHLPGRALEKAHYTWDILCSYGTLRQLQQNRIVDALEPQDLSPRHGYEVPKLIEEAGLADQFEACFDLSLRLYSLLQSAGYLQEAQYATLHGHRVRTKAAYNARESFRLYSSSPVPGSTDEYRSLIRTMHAKICEIHPLIGEAMAVAAQQKTS